MNKLAEEFQDVLDLYAKLTVDLKRIADAGTFEEDLQPLVQSILDNRDCLDEIQQLNKRLTQLYGDWKDREAAFSPSEGDEIRGVVDGVREQVRQLGKLCDAETEKIETWRKQLSGELANVGKGFRYLETIKPIKENFPKFIDSAV